MVCELRYTGVFTLENIMSVLPRFLLLFFLLVSAALAGTEGLFNGLVGTGDIGTGSAAEQKAFSAKNGFIAITSATTGRFTGMARPRCR